MTPIIVGIAGGTASGKSTLTRALVQALGDRALLVDHDRYYRPLEAHERERAASHNFDHPDALETERLVFDLAQLSRGETTNLPRYDFSCHAREATEDAVAARPIILVDGILILAVPALRACFHRTVYVDCPDDIRLIRRIRRDIRERGRTWQDVIAQYERTVRPMHEQFVAPTRALAELVVDGLAPVDQSVQAVVRLIGR